MNRDSENARGVRGRPRKASDEELLKAAYRALGEVGPQQLTLGHAARQAKVSPATLVNRFGSRETLLFKVSEMVTVETEERSSRKFSSQAALDDLFELVGQVSDVATSASTLANYVSFLQMELASPAMRVSVERRLIALGSGLKARLEAAIQNNEMIDTDIDNLVELILAVITGTQIGWLLKADESLPEQVAENIRRLLQPYRRPPASGKPKV